MSYDTKDEFIETMQNVCSYGADCGFSGFIYYSETIEFFNKNKTEIIKAIEELADSLGEDPLSMISDFNCLRSHNLSSFDVAQAIYENDSEHEAQVKDALAWFALEKVARTFKN